MKIVHVKWEDSCEQHGWTHNPILLAPLHCETVGWIIKKTKKYITISSTVAGKRTEDEQFNSPISIPMSSVKELNILSR